MFKFCRIGTINLVCYENGLILRFYKQTKKWVVCKGTLSCRYLVININGRAYLYHRVLAHAFGIIELNSPLKIDHIDRDRMNNSISNLRVVTQQQNTFNTGAKGYSWNKEKRKWEASIQATKRIRLGYFDTEEEASQAYQDAKLIYHII